MTDLRLIAAERDWSVSETVRSFVDKKVKRMVRKKKTGIDTLLELAKNVYKGQVPKDLSVNDDYLYGKLAPDYRKVK